MPDQKLIAQSMQHGELETRLGDMLIEPWSDAVEGLASDADEALAWIHDAKPFLERLRVRFDVAGLENDLRKIKEHRAKLSEVIEAQRSWGVFTKRFCRAVSEWEWRHFDELVG